MILIMNLVIKKVNPKNNLDIEKIEILIGRTIDISFKGYYSKKAVEFLKKRIHSIKQIKGSFSFGDVYLFYTRENNLIGTGSILTSKITRVYLAPECQHKGFGKIIMRYLENIAIKKGIKEIVLDAMLPAINFYVSLGYDVIDDTTYSIPNNEKIYMFKMKKSLC